MAEFAQLDDAALALLAERLRHHRGNKSAVARDLGVSRSAVSQALSRRYPADTRKLRARIVETLAARVACPHLRIDLAPADCRAYRERPIAACLGSPADVRHYAACRLCPANPAAARTACALPGDPA